ncbi:Chemotaxis protein methyltransferase CheR EC 21180 [Bradyrhizobium sp.]|uniref:terminase gpA endonuclease subunit n=1 Tax=Bradyrhizobium sp. TaxID=376 RepID=UPI0007C19B09|nr:terminase gpA endonuclease subunit [Bradyrhizobium sp.]CUT12526.1 Chemotaxis protein methyltransferase CheR EC 21180 [Bradyrhizobium sp.]
MTIQYLQTAYDRLAAVFDGALSPREEISFADWLPKNIKLVDGPNAGELWNADGAPYLVEIARCLSDDHPCTEVSIRKSEQSGASIFGLAWCLYIADCEPANTLYGTPGIEFLRDLNNAKLQPMIEAWQKHTRRDGIGSNKPPVIYPLARTVAGSTTFEKVFAGGRLWLANAHSVMDMSGKTAKKGVRDEFSKWQNIPGFGDPDTLFKGRFTAFRRRKNFKILNISTPEVDTGDPTGDTEGHCRITLKFERGDQRYWNCLCPECRKYFVHRFERFQIDEKRPHRSVYLCDCGHSVSESERVDAVRAGLWVPEISDEFARQPSFHIDAFISLMMSYEAIAEDYLGSRKSETAKKDFSTLKMGRAYRFRGDAPDHMRLFERREDYRRGHVPPPALLLAIAADVQKTGIYYEALAVAPNRESWVIDADFLPGTTTDHDDGAFLELTKLYHRSWPDAYDNMRRPDTFVIDANYNTGAVKTWARMHPGTQAVIGRDGWGRPPLSAAAPQDIDYRGKTIKGGATVRFVGTWPLKSTFYAYVSLTAKADGSALVYPVGYCHFGQFQDEAYFKQITSEHLVEQKKGGKSAKIRKQQIWDVRAKGLDNHYLDCRIYNMAALDAYFASFTADDWATLASERGIPEDLRKPDLFSPRAFQRGADMVTGEMPIETPKADDPWARLAEMNRGI